MKYLSTQLLNELYDQTEKYINKAIMQWQQLSNTNLITQPATDKWSAAQCLDHLNSYGRYYLPAIERSIAKQQKTVPSIYFKSSWLGNYFYKLMLPGQNGTARKKMKSPKDHRPGLQLDAAAVMNEYISQLETLGKLLTEAKKIDINRARVAISIFPFIKLKLGDTFLFLVAHIQRHMLQAERALEVTKPVGLPVYPLHSLLVN